MTTRASRLIWTALIAGVLGPIVAAISVPSSQRDACAQDDSSGDVRMGNPICRQSLELFTGQIVDAGADAKWENTTSPPMYEYAGRCAWNGVGQTPMCYRDGGTGGGKWESLVIGPLDGDGEWTFVGGVVHPTRTPTTERVCVGTAGTCTDTLGVEAASVYPDATGIGLYDSSAVGGSLRMRDGTSVAGQFAALVHGIGLGTGVDRAGLVLMGQPGQDGADDSGIVLQTANLAGTALTTAPIIRIRNPGGVGNDRLVLTVGAAMTLTSTGGVLPGLYVYDGATQTAFIGDGAGAAAVGILHLRSAGALNVLLNSGTADSYFNTGQDLCIGAASCLDRLSVTGDIRVSGAVNANASDGTANLLLHGGATATWAAIDLAADVTGLLAVGNAGMGADMTAAGAGEIAYSTAAGAYTGLAAGGADQLMSSGGAAAPVWETDITFTTTTLRIDDHHITSEQTTAPTTDLTGTTLNDGGGAGAACAVTAGGTDTAGHVTITAGNGTPGVGLACLIAWDTAYTTGPRSLQLTCADVDCADRQVYVTTRSTTQMGIAFAAALATDEVVELTWLVME